ncbi:hypothetical protein EJ03DRAFT_249281, partial [Teratosphaeria nubilosa]
DLVFATAPGIHVTVTAHVLFILGILLSTIVFAHSLVRMCLLRRQIASSDSPRFYVVQHGRLKRSRRPHAYHTTWDKNLDANLPHPPPPAYGRWRGSVRANPELLHWSPVVPPGTPT